MLDRFRDPDSNVAAVYSSQSLDAGEKRFRPFFWRCFPDDSRAARCAGDPPGARIVGPSAPPLLAQGCRQQFFGDFSVAPTPRCFQRRSPFHRVAPRHRRVIGGHHIVVPKRGIGTLIRSWTASWPCPMWALSRFPLGSDSDQLCTGAVC
jgi:hypothetical protein